MKLSTYHSHSTFSDGKNTAEEMILAAIERGCPEIGFSEHSPIENSKWSMSSKNVDRYTDTLKQLREKYKDKIKVYIGIEQDFRSVNSTDEYDFIIGSVHSVETPAGEIEVDGSAEVVRAAVMKYFDGDPYAYCEAYYSRVSEIYERTKCDIIGHFDLITKFIEIDPLFFEEHPRYMKARDSALEKLLKAPALFEVNTGAISRGYRHSPYPRPDVIKRIAAVGKKLVVTSDSHKAETVDFAIDDTARVLDFLGAPYVTSLREVLEYTRK